MVASFNWYNVMIERLFDIPFVAGLALREKQIQQNYRPPIAVHKWFARRPGTLFRALMLSEFVDSGLRDSSYESHDLRGVRVADPLMGGGTPLMEANRIGCDVVGCDINPMAYWIVRQEIEHLDLRAYRKAAIGLRSAMEKEVGQFYRTTCLECGNAAANGVSLGSLDAVFTDPPYFGNVQYAELMDFCYVWLRKLIGRKQPRMALLSPNPLEHRMNSPPT